MANLCVVGSANVDLTFRTPRLPLPGETLTARSLQVGLGGKGANQAVAAARLGAHVVFVARVGNDAFADEALRYYRAEGLDVTHVQRDAELPTGTAAIYVDDQAQNCIVVAPGANGALRPDDIRAAEAAIARADALLCQLEVPIETTLEAFRLAKKAGVRTVLTPAPAVPLPAERLALCDLCVPNQTEIEILCTRRLNAEDFTTAALELQRRGPSAVVLTLGERGALLVERETVDSIPPYPVNAVDPTGAGDAFTAALAVFWSEGRPLSQAARYASAAAALTVTRPGTLSAFPTRPEVEALASRG